MSSPKHASTSLTQEAASSVAASSPASSSPNSHLHHPPHPQHPHYPQPNPDKRPPCLASSSSSTVTHTRYQHLIGPAHPSSGFITGLIITTLTPSSSSSSAASAVSTAEPGQTSGFLFVINSHPHQIPTSHQPCSSQPGPGGKSSPSPPSPPPMPAQKRVIYQGNDHPPPSTKAWFIKDCGVEPPLNTSYEGRTQLA